MSHFVDAAVAVDVVVDVVVVGLMKERIDRGLFAVDAASRERRTRGRVAVGELPCDLESHARRRVRVAHSKASATTTPAATSGAQHHARLVMLQHH